MKLYPSCIMATCCVPWDGAGGFAEEIFRRSVQGMLARTKHLYIFGTAGEGYAVTDRQFEQVVACFADEMRKGNAEPMVGVISLSLGTVLDRIDRARQIGVRQFQISLPSWGALNERELFTFFHQVCGGFPDCQFMHYNLPRAKRMLTGKEYAQLASAHTNLVATKNTSDSLSHIESLIEDAAPMQHFLSERGYAHGCLFGECGILASLVMNWPKLHALWEAGQRRDLAAMAPILRECDSVLKTLFQAVPQGRMDGAYDKLFAKMYDPEFPLRLLPPYEGASNEEFAAFIKLLSERLPHWVPAQAN